MDIVLLSGKQNSGKTETINLVYGILIAKGANVVIPKMQVGGNPRDFECVLELKGKNIAIYSMGDYLCYCWSAVIKYAYCDKLIMAYNDKFKQNLSAYVGSCSNHKVVPKSYGSASVNNQNDASTVVSHI